jgi:hypothetical protein
MRIQLPKAKWHRLIGDIDMGATSGWNWNPPADTAGPGFLRPPCNVDAGAVIVSHEVGTGARNAQAYTYLWVVAGDNILQSFGCVAADHLWAPKLRAIAAPLLKLPPLCRALLAVSARMGELRRGPDFDLIDSESAVHEASVLRAQYLHTLRTNAGIGAGERYGQDRYLNESFLFFLHRQCPLLDMELDDVLDRLSDFVPALGALIQQTGSPRPVSQTPTALQQHGGRNLVLRRR